MNNDDGDCPPYSIPKVAVWFEKSQFFTLYFPLSILVFRHEDFANIQKRFESSKFFFKTISDYYSFLCFGGNNADALFLFPLSLSHFARHHAIFILEAFGEIGG